MYDRVVIQEILKEIAQTQQVDLAAKQRFKGMDPEELALYCRYKHYISGCYQRGGFPEP